MSKQKLTPEEQQKNRDNYQKNKARMDTASKAYRKRNSELINYNNRVRALAKKGKPWTPMKFSFCRDFLIPLASMIETEGTIKIWSWLFDLNLTNIQRSILERVKEGKTMTQIAIERKTNISSIVKTVNGNADYNAGGKKYGGIWNKVRRSMEKDPSFVKYLNLEDIDHFDE